MFRPQDIHIWDGNGSREFLDQLGLKDREEGDLGPGHGPPLSKPVKGEREWVWWWGGGNGFRRLCGFVASVFVQGHTIHFFTIRFDTTVVFLRKDALIGGGRGLQFFLRGLTSANSRCGCLFEFARSLDPARLLGKGEG